MNKKYLANSKLIIRNLNTLAFCFCIHSHCPLIMNNIFLNQFCFSDKQIENNILFLAHKNCDTTFITFEIPNSINRIHESEYLNKFINETHLFNSDITKIENSFSLYLCDSLGLQIIQINFLRPHLKNHSKTEETKAQDFNSLNHMFSALLLDVPNNSMGEIFRIRLNNIYFTPYSYDKIDLETSVLQSLIKSKNEKILHFAWLRKRINSDLIVDIKTYSLNKKGVNHFFIFKIASSFSLKSSKPPKFKDALSDKLNCIYAYIQ